MRSAPEYKEGNFAEKRGHNDKEEPQTPEPGRLLDEAGKTKIALTRRNSRGHRPQKREPVQLIEMLPIPRTETRPQRKNGSVKKALKKTNGGD